MTYTMPLHDAFRPYLESSDVDRPCTWVQENNYTVGCIVNISVYVILPTLVSGSASLSILLMHKKRLYLATK